MTLVTSKLGLLLVVFTFAYGEQERDSTEKKPPSEKAKLRDWFFRLSLRNDLINLTKDGQDYLAIVKLRTDDGEHFSILFDEDHPHPKNNCSSQPATEGKQTRFVMQGLEKEFLCTEIRKKIPDVPEARSVDLSDASNGREVEDSLINFREKTKTIIEETKQMSEAAGENKTVDEDSNLPQKITDFNKTMDAVATSDETPASDKDSDGRSPIVYPAVDGQMSSNEKAKTPGGLDPLIDHLNGVASHEHFNNPVYAKAIEDLVKDLESHDQSEANWDREKLNTVLDKIEELVTGKLPEKRAGPGDENNDARTGTVASGAGISPLNETLAEDIVDNGTTTDPSKEEATLAKKTTTNESVTLANGITIEDDGAFVDETISPSSDEKSVNGTTTPPSNDTLSPADSAAQSEDDAPKSTDLNEMLSTWKKKFHIILGFFIVFMVLFLVIIGVLIYKIKQNKTDSALLQGEK